MRHSKLLFGSITVMGIVLVTFFFTILYWIRALDYHIAIVEAVVPYPAIDYLMAISVISGTTLLTIGMLWIGRLFVKKRKNLFSVFAAILTPTLIFALFISMVVFVSGDFFAPERLAITKVRVDNTNPLTLSLNMKSFYIYDIYFGYASIKDKNEIPLVPAVEIISDWIVGDYDAWGEPVWTIDWLGKLPGGSEKTVTLNFNTSIPSGNYQVSIRTDRCYTFTSPYFTIP